MSSKARSVVGRVILYAAIAGVGASLVLLTRPPELAVVLDPESDMQWWMLDRDRLLEYLKQSIACTDELAVFSDDVFGNRGETTVITDKTALRNLSEALDLTSEVNRFHQPTLVGPYYYLDLKCKHRIRFVILRDAILVGPWGDRELPNDWMFGTWWAAVGVAPEFNKQLLSLVKEPRAQQQMPMK